MLDRVHGQRASYNVPCLYRVGGLLDTARLQRSLDAIVRRHETLRTAFRFDGHDVVQVILPDVIVPIALHVAGQGDEERRVLAAIEAATEAAARPFDLETAPLLRVDLYRVTERHHLLLLCFHHAIFDGWSGGIFLDELSELYRTFSDEASAVPLGRLPIQYRDVAAWQREQVTSAAAAASLEYWRQRLTGAPGTLNLPLDYPRPSDPTNRGGQEAIFLRRDQVAALTAVSRRGSATLFMTLLAAYALLLHRYSDDREAIIGTALAGRTRSEFEPLIGFFVNTVALRIDFGGEPTFLELLERVKKTFLDAYSHQDVPFDKVVEALQPQRTSGLMPFMQTIFVMQISSSQRHRLGELTVEPVRIHNRTSKCDLVLSVEAVNDGRDGLWCVLEYDAELFKPETAKRLLDSYRSVVDAASVDPDGPIAAFPIVSAADHALLEVWSRTEAEYRRESTIHREFEAVAARAPAAIAVTGEAESLTYAALNARANHLAARLRREGVQRGELVGIYLDRSIEAIVAQLAVLKAGAAYLPLDPAYPESRLRFILQDASVRIVLAHSSAADRLPSGAATILALDRQAEEIAEPAAANSAGGAADDLAYVMYTSGSTGRPNGVRIAHRGVLRLVLGANYISWERATTFLQLAPLSFDASTFEVWGPLLRGRRLVLFPARSPSVPLLADVLQAQGVDCLWLTAGLFNAVIDERPDCLAGVSQLIVGGEPLSVSHVRMAQAHLPATEIINGYGPTECTTFACCYPIPRLPAHIASIPIGRPIGNTSVQLLDARGQPVPIGSVGELYIGGDGVALGYHDRPQLTAERFVTDPTGRSARRWYRTGDRARWSAEGVLEFHGRLDEQLKIRGFRVEPGEIEAACRQHPAVRDAAVVLQKRTATDARLVAFIVGEAGPPPGTEDVKAFLANQLPPQLIPAEVMVVGSLPLTPNGKVDRRALSLRRRDPAEAPKPAAAGPRNANEEALSRIWCSLLQIDSIGIHDDFFALGGHSLLAVRMFAQIESVFQRRLPISSLLRHSTIAELSRLLERDTIGEAVPAGDHSSLIEIQRGDGGMPIFFVHGIGGNVVGFKELASLLGPDQPVYGIQARGLCDDHPPDTSIEDMAAHYAALVRMVRPHGPYALAGFSFGGVVAFEMARRLTADGARVALLALLDAAALGSHRLLPRSTHLRRASALFARRITFHAGKLWRLGRGEKIGYVVKKARTLRRRARSRLWRVQFRLYSLGRPLAPAALRTPGVLPDRFRNITESLTLAVSGYTPKPYAGSATLFRARDKAAFFLVDPTLGWGALVERLEIREVPGDHLTLLTKPHVETLAAELKSCLHEARTAARMMSA